MRYRNKYIETRGLNHLQTNTCLTSANGCVSSHTHMIGTASERIQKETKTTIG